MDFKKLFEWYNKYFLLIIMFLIILIIFLLFNIFYLKLIINKNNIQINNIENKLKIYVDKENQISKERNLIKEKELLERKKIEEIYSIDLETDKEITKFISAKVPFNDKTYIPKQLELLKWEYIIDIKWSQKVRKETNIALNNLAKAFYKKFQKKIIIVSAYRSYNYQKWIKDRGCPDLFCAKAWYSEHQSWLAVDLWEATSKKQFLSKPNLKKYYNWLSENAYKYWFHNTYQKWLEIDTYVAEPWHWRYMWIRLATYLYKENMTFAEFYNKK